MKHLQNWVLDLAVSLPATVILCYCAHLITSYEFLAPAILAIVLGCIFLLLVFVWALVFLDFCDQSGASTSFSNGLQAKLRAAHKSHLARTRNSGDSSAQGK